jgi:hypothetical protein
LEVWKLQTDEAMASSSQRLNLTRQRWRIFYLCFPFCSLIRFLRVRDFFSADSLLSRSSFETLNTCRRALLNFSASVLPGTSDAGSGFMLTPLYIRQIRALCGGLLC